MDSLRTRLSRLLLSLSLVGLLLAGLAACGGGGGGSTADGPQGIRIGVDSSYTQMVYSVDITGPTGTTQQLLGLSPGQEMFFALPTGDYSLKFWIHAGGGISVVDHTLRYATVIPSHVTQVVYP